MSVLLFRDQNGNPVWGLATRIARGHGDTTKAEDERYPDKAGSTAFVGVKIVLPSPAPPEYPDPGHTVHVNFNEGLNPNWRDYATASVYLPDIEAVPSGYTITVHHTGVQPPVDLCPVNFDKEQFRKWFDSVKVGSGITTANMQAMQASLKKCGFEWQNNCRDSHEWRPRIHQPPFLNGPCSGSTHDVDCGDFGGPWTLTFRY